MSTSCQTVRKIESLKQSVIHIDPERVLAPVDEKIYSGFVEHLGRCIYGGLVDYSDDPKCKVNDKGYREDVCQAIDDLKMPVVRWPGGNFVQSYHWIDGVGPKDKRPRRPELAWLGEESNLFGTDEFMEWCRHMNVEPYLCLNMGTGTLDEALAWIEYCNSDANTYYANLRRKHGHPEPYNVKYWGLGNEVWGDWQVGQMNKEDYAKMAEQWSKAIKLLNPDVELVSCGCDGLDNWDHHVLDKLINWVDYHSIHIYTANDDYMKNVTAPASAEIAIQITKNLIELAGAQHPPKANGVNSFKAEKKKVRICFDEWNVWDPTRADGTQGAEEQYTFSDAIAIASWLNVFIRQAEALGMCNLAQLVNVIAPIMTNDSTIFLQTTYHPLKLFSNFMRGDALDLYVESTMYEGPTGNNDGRFTWLQGNHKIPILDVSAVQNGEHTYVSVVNRSEDEDTSTKVVFSSKIDNIYQWSLYDDDLSAFNDFENPERVVMKEQELEFSQSDDLTVTFEFPKHSFTMLKVTYK